MTCPDCAAMKGRLAELEKRLGVSRQLSSIGAVMERFEVGATKARLMLRLYEAGGKYVCTDKMMDVMSTDSVGSLKTTLCQLRGKLDGDGMIESANGLGYRLSVAGMSRMLAALERPAFQDDRG